MHPAAIVTPASPTGSPQVNFPFSTDSGNSGSVYGETMENWTRELSSNKRKNLYCFVIHLEQAEYISLSFDSFFKNLSVYSPFTIEQNGGFSYPVISSLRWEVKAAIDPLRPGKK